MLDVVSPPAELPGLVILAAGIFIAWAYQALSGWLLGDPPSMWKSLSFTVTVVATILVFLGNKLWPRLWRRFPILHKKLFPDLNGRWIGMMVSTWINPETNQSVPPIPTEITIRQGLFSTIVSLKTQESTSHSTRSFLERFPETSRFRIWYSYNNDPQAQYQRRSSPHEGVAFLELNFDADSDRLTGRYYTARKTIGDIDVRRATA